MLARVLLLLAVCCCAWNLLLPALPSTLARGVARPELALGKQCTKHRSSTSAVTTTTTSSSSSSSSGSTSAESTSSSATSTSFTRNSKPSSSRLHPSPRFEIAVLLPAQLVPSHVPAGEGLCEQLARAGATVFLTDDESLATEGADFVLAIGAHALPPGRLRARYAALRTVQLDSDECDERCKEHALGSELALVASSPRDAQHMRTKQNIQAVRVLPPAIPARLLYWRPPLWINVGALWGAPIVDCSIIGGTPEWRDEVAEALHQRRVRVDTSPSEHPPGPLRDVAVSRGTVVLNLHEVNEASLEMQRLAELLAMKRVIVSERSADSVLDAAAFFGDAIRFPRSEYNESLADAVVSVLLDKRKRRQMKLNGRAFAERMAFGTSDAVWRIVGLKRSGPPIFGAPLSPSRDRARRPLPSLAGKQFRAGIWYESRAA